MRSVKAFKITIFQLLVLFILVGCGEDKLFSPPREIIDIIRIVPERDRLCPGDVIWIRAEVEQTGSSQLIYRWSATGGVISPSGREATYIAPNEPGEYEISLTVEGQNAVDHKTIKITVIPSPQHRILIAKEIYFPHNLPEGVLRFKVKIEAVFGPVWLKYHILQVNDRFDSILSIYLNEDKLLSKPVGQVLSSGEEKGTLNLTDVIGMPGIYTFSFSIKPANRVKKGWMLKEAVLENVEGELIG